MKSELAPVVARRVTLLRTFSVLSAVILTLIAIGLAWSLQGKFENLALDQQKVVVEEQAQLLLNAGLGSALGSPRSLTPRVLGQLGRFATTNMKYGHFVRIKVWNRQGEIIYSDAPRAIGFRQVPMGEDLEAVLDGTRWSSTDISDLSDPENATERGQFTHLMEVYVPIQVGQGAQRHIVGAYEAYHDLTTLDGQLAQLRWAIWLSVGAGFIVLYFSLFLVVRNASRRLVSQITENVRLLQEAQRREADATLLLRAGERLRLNVDRATVLQQILESMCATLGYLNCSLLLYSREDNCLYQHVGTGALADVPLGRRVEIEEGVIGRAAHLRQIVNVPDVSLDDGYIVGVAQTQAEIAVPLLVGEELIGVLNVDSAHKNAFGQREVTLLSVLADQAAMAIQNANLFTQREEAYLAALDAMARTIDARDRYTHGHSHRVAAYAVAIADVIGLGDEVGQVLRRGGVLHDIGKIGVSDAVLKKPGPLSPEETAEMQEHAVIGYNLLRDMPFLDDELGLIRHHHERWDGRGYPDGLAGEEIPLTARILAVADAFDAMTSDRPYRRGLPLTMARGRLVEGAGIQFWPPAVEGLVGLIDSGGLSALMQSPDLLLINTVVA